MFQSGSWYGGLNQHLGVEVRTPGLVGSAEACGEHARWVEEEIPTTLGTPLWTMWSLPGESRGKRKQERFEAGTSPDPFTALLLSSWGGPAL